jgi:ubiquinone biosynthesis protein
MQLTSLIRSRYRFAGDLGRAAEVARVLVKYGLAGWLSDVDWAAVRSALRSAGGEVLAQQPFEARLRLAITDLGTTYIKLGQMLSTRPDLVGKPLADELSKLQQQTPPDPPEVVTRVVHDELGRTPEEMFREFDQTALASASIGQVHAARLKSGRRAVVKVQHPGIEGTIRRDLDIMAFLADLAEKNDILRGFQPVSLIREFSRTLLNELDFRREQRNLQVFRRNFADDQTVVFPKPCPELTTDRVLTMGFVKGYKLTDEARLGRMKVDRQELARRGANIFVQMIFRDGFYHADPHPGNLVVMKDGKIGLLDAGMVGRIDEGMRRQVVDILMSAADRDGQRLTDAVLRVCGSPRGVDRTALSSDLTEFFEDYGTQEVGQFNVSGALSSITNVLHMHNLVLPGNLSMLIKCLMLLEGTGRLLSPTFNLAELLEPWRQKLIREKLSPATHLKEIRRLYADWERAAEELPKSLTNLVDRLERGTFSLRLEHEHLKSAANRLVSGIFIGALLVGSTIMLAQNVSPLMRGLSVLGLIGYVGAMLLGLRMLWINRDSAVSRRDGDWD